MSDEFTKLDTQKTIANADFLLLKHTKEYENTIDNKIIKYDEYVEAKNEYLKSFYHALMHNYANSEVSRTLVEKLSKAEAQEQEFAMNLAESAFKAAQDKVAVEWEKINTLKKLIDFKKQEGG